MTKKIGDKKLGGVTSTTEASGIQKTEGIGEVKSIQATTGVGGVGKAGAVGKRRSTRVMSLAEREALMNMIGEEAEKMFADGTLSASNKELVTNAVKMAVDAGLVPDEDKED
jgi:hypothetical protein